MNNFRYCALLNERVIMSSVEDKKHIKTLITKMFDYLDTLKFKQLREEILAKNLFFDIYPTHIEPKVRTAVEACEIFNSYSHSVDATNRKIGDIIVSVEDKRANVFTSTTVTHFKKNTINENTRELNGDYHLILTKVTNEWKVSSFIYSANQVYGNITLE